MNRFVIYMLLPLLIVIGCSNKSSVRTDWLTVVGGDTVYVQEAADIWNGMDDSARNQFLEDQDPSMSFLNTIIEKRLLELGAEDAGYLDSDLFKAMKCGWIRTQMSIVEGNRIQNRIISEVTEDDIAGLRAHKYDLAHLTMMPGTPREAPVSTPFVQLPYESVVQIDSLQVGDIAVDRMHNSFRLDSITEISPSDSIYGRVEAYTDSAFRDAIGAARTRDFSRSIENSCFGEYNVRIDTLSMVEVCYYFADSIASPPENTVVESDLRNWTGPELVAEGRLVQSILPLNLSSPSQMLFLIQNLVRQAAMESMLIEEEPTVIDSITAAADSVFMKAAVESLYVDSVLSIVVPGAEQMILTGRIIGNDTQLPENAGQLIEDRLNDVLSGYEEQYGVEINHQLIDSIPQGKYIWDLTPADAP